MKPSLESSLPRVILVDLSESSREGGEEFVIALPNTDLAGAEVVAERLRQAVVKAVIEHGGKSIPVTVSLGVSAMHKGETLEGLIERTDQAMYAAKVKGRNCIAVSALERRLVAAPASKAAV